MLAAFKRIIKAGWRDFTRNLGLSLVTIFAIFLAVSLVTSIFVFRGAANFVIRSLESKFDISVYFKEDTSEKDIFRTKNMLLDMAEVESVDYVSKDQALADFKLKHLDNQVITDALNEIGDNPFLAALNIKAASASSYEAINQFLNQKSFNNLIDKVDYYQTKPIIERFYSLSANIQKIGLVLALVLAIIAFAIAFMTVRLTIQNSGEEIGIMRLVGADNWFILGPFVCQGIISGLFASLIGLAVFGLVSYTISPFVFTLTSGFQIFPYFVSNLLAIIGIQILTGVGLGAVSSLVAVGQYLKK